MSGIEQRRSVPDTGFRLSALRLSAILRRMHALPAQSVDRFRCCFTSLVVVPQSFGVAVSGGPDSLALLMLATAAFPGSVRAATVDHGLRAESRAEAAMVAAVCDGLHVPHVTLPVHVDTARSSLQRSAREARYAALAAWLADAGLGMLVTGHHADDQAETLIMRLLRGAGVGGLASVRPVAPLPAQGSRATLVRPLLGWRRKELAEIVASTGVAPADDPSNRDPRHDRVRVRELLGQCPWLDPMPLARSAAALAEADEALHWATDRFGEQRISAAGDILELDPTDLPAEIRRRLVLHMLARCRPESSPPRGEEVGRLLARLDAGGTATLAGVKCIGGKRWQFQPEKRPRAGRARTPASS